MGKVHLSTGSLQDAAWGWLLVSWGRGQQQLQKWPLHSCFLLPAGGSALLLLQTWLFVVTVTISYSHPLLPQAQVPSINN